MARRMPYHLRHPKTCESKCGGAGIVKPLGWWRDLDDNHGYKTVVKNATCKVCKADLEREGIFSTK